MVIDANSGFVLFPEQAVFIDTILFAEANPCLKEPYLSVEHYAKALRDSTLARNLGVDNERSFICVAGKPHSHFLSRESSARLRGLHVDYLQSYYLELDQHGRVVSIRPKQEYQRLLLSIRYILTMQYNADPLAPCLQPMIYNVDLNGVI